MSRQQTTQDLPAAAAEQQYAADARRWLRAYPPRWRRAREEEVLGVLLDTRPPGARRLDLTARRDLVQGGLTYRRRSHPPLLAWLLYRAANVRLPSRYAEWVRDDVAGRLYPLRLVWGGWLLLFTAFNVLLHLRGELSAPWFLALFVAGASVVSMVAVRARSRRRILEEVLQADERIAAVRTDEQLRWSGRRRWSYGRWLAVPVLAGWLGIAVVVVWAAAAASGASGTDVVAALPRPDAASPVVLAWATVWVGYGGVVLAACRRRVLDRPAQPWRDEPRAPHPVLVSALAAVAAVVPLAVAAGPLGALMEATDASSALLVTAAPVVHALAPLSFGMGFLGAPLLAVVLVAPLVHLRVRRVLTGRGGPRPALLDVMGLVGGREVLVDPPVVPARPVPWA